MSEGGDLPELDAEALALLAAFRDDEVVPTAVKRRVWGRVSADRTAAAVASWRRWALVGALAAAAAVVLAIGVRAVLPTTSVGVPVQAHYVEEPRPIPGGQAEAIEPEPSIAPSASGKSGPGVAPLEEGATDLPAADVPDQPRTPPPPTIRPPTPPRRAAPTSPTRPVSPPAVVDTLAEETRMLRRARGLVARDPKAALGVLDEIERRFPAGVLVEERQALRVIGLCGVGDRARGSAAAERFIAAHAGSALVGRVRRACAKNPDEKNPTPR